MARKTQEEIKLMLTKLRKQKFELEEELGRSLHYKDRLSIQISMLEGKATYNTYSSDTDQETDSIAYDTSEWLKGNYCDPDEELFATYE